VTIRLDRKLEQALNEQARQKGVAPEALALNALRERFTADSPSLEPRDDWERALLDAGSDCGLTLPDSALSSDELYD